MTDIITSNEGNGSKYLETKSLDIKEIAKLVRADIKAAVSDGRLPAGTKCSVTISRYAGGQSLNVRVTECPVQIETDEFVISNPNVFFQGDRRTAESKAVTDTLEEIRGAYNYDRSDIQSDYFNVRYYGHAEFDWQMAKADRERTVARLAVGAA